VADDDDVLLTVGPMRLAQYGIGVCTGPERDFSLEFHAQRLGCLLRSCGGTGHNQPILVDAVLDPFRHTRRLLAPLVGELAFAVIHARLGVGVAPENQFHGPLLNALTASNNRALHKRTATRNIAVTTGSPSACTVSGTTATLITVGTCYIYANQAGNLNYSALKHRMRYSSSNQLSRFEVESAYFEKNAYSDPERSAECADPECS
jgi:hypothetical protein